MPAASSGPPALSVLIDPGALPVMLRRLLPLLVLSVLALAALPAAGASALQDGLLQKTLYKSGNSGRYLVSGTWLFRLDPMGAGTSQGFATNFSTAGWKDVAVPNAWNAGDYSDASFAGGVGWYRKDFHLPSSAKALSWIVRFESVNYRSIIYLNGHQIGKNTGAYIPFEVRLPASLLKRGAVNHLVVRVDDHRLATDFPPAGLSTKGVPTGGWWNYGGLLREVYLRKVDKVDITNYGVLPDLPCGTCAATLHYSATLRNSSDHAVKVKVTGRLGASSVSLGSATIDPGAFHNFTRTLAVPRPHDWSPDDPYLYTTSLAVTSGKSTLQTFYNRTGIRSVQVVDGHLMLNGKPLHMRGFGIHEDTADKGFAIDDAQREQQIQWAREAGADLIRSHYPLHPYYYERLDELGMLAWTEVPVYSVKTKYLKRRIVRQLAAKELAKAVTTNLNHPSILVWSVGNELSSKPGPVQADYIAHAVRQAKALDPTRPVGIAIAGYPSAGCQPEYGPLDVIGINDYFGWYPGPSGQIADETLLPDYLDSVHACYPKKAIIVTETGAEANRDGPVEERGTYEFQQAYADYHEAVYASKPWLSGAIWWALEEFYVRPGWDGGNPWPAPPLHQKGLITLQGVKKPAFANVQRAYKAVKEYG